MLRFIILGLSCHKGNGVLLIAHQMACMLFPLLLLLSSGPVAARNEDVPQEWSWKEYPHPMVDTEGCGRRDQASLICDPNLILKYEQGNNELLPYCAFHPLCRLSHDD